ncbi:MAG TPA: hypothetical protein VEI25_07745, partial [Paraburkholderia sp.]|nr:hypothetical protein [Paraburkholderia sp.]
MESLTKLEPGHSVWTWVQPPSPLTQVCAVTDDTTPRAVSDALAERFKDVPQFALLHLAAPEALRTEWVASCETPVHAPHTSHSPHTPHAHSRIDTLLALLPGPCRLVLCTQSARSLDWLGSVRGHSCRFALPDTIASDAGPPDSAIDAIDAIVVLLHETLTE